MLEATFTAPPFRRVGYVFKPLGSLAVKTKLSQNENVRDVLPMKRADPGAKKEISLYASTFSTGRRNRSCSTDCRRFSVILRS